MNPDDSWDPWTLDQINQLVSEERNSLSSEHVELLAPWAVPPRTVKASDGPGADGQSYWVIARRGDKECYWNSIEEEFGLGMIRDDVLHGAGTIGERLEWALARLATT